MEDGREGARGGQGTRGMERGRDKGSEIWREGARGGREEAMMIGRERECQWRKGGSLKGTSEEGKDRGMDGAMARWGGRKRAEDGLSEEGMEQGREGNFKVCILMMGTGQVHNREPGRSQVTI